MRSSSSLKQTTLSKKLNRKNLQAVKGGKRAIGVPFGSNKTTVKKLMLLEWQENSLNKGKREEKSRSRDRQDEQAIIAKDVGTTQNDVIGEDEVMEDIRENDINDALTSTYDLEHSEKSAETAAIVTKDSGEAQLPGNSGMEKKDNEKDNEDAIVVASSKVDNKAATEITKPSRSFQYWVRRIGRIRMRSLLI